MRDGADTAQLGALERQLGMSLPPELRALLVEFDGFEDLDGQWEVAWSTRRMALENVRLRAEGLLHDGGICFGDNGCGEPFCILPEGAVSVIYPTSGETQLLAGSLREFWEGWLTGTVST